MVRSCTLFIPSMVLNILVCLGIALTLWYTRDRSSSYWTETRTRLWLGKVQPGCKFSFRAARRPHWNDN